MKDAPQSIVLVTPVWNDAARLEVFGAELASALAAADLGIRWIVADDGSGEAEQQRIRELIERFSAVYPLVEAMLFTQRSRKGGAIYAAWDACPDAAWLGFVDADGAINADSTLRLIRHAIKQGLDGGCVGIRQDAEDTPVERPPGRALSFRIFSFLVRFLLGIRFQDTQCGAKVLPGRGYFAVAEKLQERGFIFDVELLLALDCHGYSIEELPIPWKEMRGGKVNPFLDAWPMVAGLWRIRQRLKAGYY
ncbi:MAG: glycosyltransferase [Puniceicoccaceae bacterium]|nr:MAG: glycosyltransferase [Puniceicoccaceae bacterium]